MNIYIEDLVSNAIIEQMAHGGNDFISLHQVEEYGRDVIADLRKKNFDAHLILSRGHLQSFLVNYKNYFHKYEVDGTIYFYKASDITLNDLIKKFRGYLPLPILQSMMCDDVVGELLDRQNPSVGLDTFVASSSSDELESNLYTECHNLLSQILNDNDNLIFGAMNHGIMKISYDIATEKGCYITGVVPEIYKDDFSELDCDREITVDRISERTDYMVESSDVVLILPGGIGTINEFFSALEKKGNKEYSGEIILYNCEGMYEKLIEFLDGLHLMGFTRNKPSDLCKIANNTETVGEIFHETRIKKYHELSKNKGKRLMNE